MEEPAKLKKEFFTYFSNQFRESSDVRPGFKSKRFKQLSPDQAARVQALFTDVVIKEAVWNCADQKAPDSDDFTFTFLKRH